MGEFKFFRPNTPDLSEEFGGSGRDCPDVPLSSGLSDSFGS